MTRRVLSVWAIVVAVLVLALGSIERIEALENVVVNITAAPSTVIYGHRPITVVVEVQNPTASAVSFDGTIWHGYPAWGGEDAPYSFSAGTQVYWLVGDQQGIMHWWRGTVQPNASVYFTLPTFSGVQLGTHRFVSATFTSPAMSQEKYVTVVQGTDPASGVFSLAEQGSWLPGQLRGLNLTLTAPMLTQFMVPIGGLTSTCGIVGLGNPGRGQPSRTYQEFQWYVQLPETAIPGKCLIKGTVNLSGQASIYPEFEFTIPDVPALLNSYTFKIDPREVKVSQSFTMSWQGDTLYGVNTYFTTKIPQGVVIPTSTNSACQTGQGCTLYGSFPPADGTQEMAVQAFALNPRNYMITTEFHEFYSSLHLTKTVTGIIKVK